MKYKDRCDVCNKFDYCKGYDGLVLCDKCFQKQLTLAKENKSKQESTKESKKQISLFD